MGSALFGYYMDPATQNGNRYFETRCRFYIATEILPLATRAKGAVFVHCFIGVRDICEVFMHLLIILLQTHLIFWNLIYVLLIFTQMETFEL